MTLPDGVEMYKRTATFTADTVPAALLRDHKTKAGVWGRLVVEEGALTFRFVDEAPFGVRAGEDVSIPPEKPHAVTPEAGVRFHVEFFRATET